MQLSDRYEVVLAEIPDADWMRFYEVNVMSGIRLTRGYFPTLATRAADSAALATAGRAEAGSRGSRGSAAGHSFVTAYMRPLY